ncbi:MAG TPA: lysophospholipid acyltransferase family protein [Solirubrobacteraceae bacterium]|nr:lysophospholipid acyltransferase family protein [Solirubrobacteraceae bacterium]
MFRFRRKRSRKQRFLDAARAAPARGLDAARAAPARGRELRKAAAQLDIPWARSWLAGVIRENFLRFVLNPTMDYYAARRATGKEKLEGVKGPVILVANHASHMDTPVILSALPRKLRKRTVVAAAADYFYKNRVVASLVSLIFNTVPIERHGGGGVAKNGSHLDKLLDQGWSLLLYPEGTRSRGGMPGPLRRGAAVLAAAHHLTIVPIRVTGTAQAMPPGRLWPRRLRDKPVPKRHRIEVSFGEPIIATGDPGELMDSVRGFFENGGAPTPYRSPYRQRATVKSER